MTGHRRLGIHWGETGFSFVEVSREAPTLTAFVPFPEQGVTLGIKNLSQDIALLDVLQKTVRNKGFSTTETYLSLPSKDILIRWFFIPWMKTSEIQSVVSFEAKKYIPFNIDETAYTYYPTTVTHEGIRQIGVLFVAIRKSVFEKYINVLIQAGLNVVYSEPAAMSLVRALMFRRQVNLDHVTAILRTEQDTGELIILSKGHVKFTRDFKIQSPEPLNLAAAGQPLPEDVEEVLRARIFNEVRISLEFFSRQYSEEDVTKIVILSSGLKQSFWTGLNDELGVPMEIVDPLREIPSGEGMSAGGIYAFGAAMAGKVPAVIDFNLSEGASQSVSLKKEEIVEQNQKLILPIIVGVACAALIAIVFFVSGFFLDGLRTKINVVKTRVGANVEMTTVDLSAKTAAQKKELAALESLPLKARLTPLVIRLVKQLPKGVWLQNISVTFKDTPPSAVKKAKKTAPEDAKAVKEGADAGDVKDKKASTDKKKGSPAKVKPVYGNISTNVEMEISGYIYLNDSNAEFGLANQLVSLLRKDEELKALFKNIKLVSVKSDVYAEFKVTVFQILCEGK
jgi:Tfp pilus assembly PilM family ATPase